MTESLRNIMVLVVIIVSATLGWFMFDQSRQLELQMTGGPGVNIQAETQQFIQQQRRLQQLDVTTDLFTDRNFQNLFSVTAPVPTFPFGRDNPFTPTF